MQVLYNYCDNTGICNNINPSDITNITNLFIPYKDIKSIGRFIYKSTTIIEQDKQMLFSFLDYISVKINDLYKYCNNNICNYISKMDIYIIQNLIGFTSTSTTSFTST